MSEQQNLKPEFSQNAIYYAEQVKRDVLHAGNFLRETGTLSPTLTFQASQRVPGEDVIVSAHYPNGWDNKGDVPTIDDINASFSRVEDKGRYNLIFQQFADINTVVHFHTPYVGSWSSAHRTFPILYVAVQRHTLTRELPIYIDRRPSEASYIVDQLRENPHLPAILEANGGATAWGKSILEVAQFVLRLEEGAKFQTIAEYIGGSKPYGPGVLEQQWSRTGLTPAAVA